VTVRAVASDPTPARRAAWQILERVRRGATFEAALDPVLASLEERDRRLAHELAAGVLRRQRELDGRLEPLVPSGLKAVKRETLQILRLGAYQLTALDRIPAHAAVSTSVDLAREVSGKSAARFVNAVLRRLHSGSVPAPAPPGDPIAALAQRYSHPTWLVVRWAARYGMAGATRLLEWNNQVPPLVLQAAREDLAHVRQRLTARGIAADPAPFEAGLVAGHTRPTELPGYEEGAFQVQDAAQALVLRYAALPAEAVVYDACAAPGGKAIGLGRVVRTVVAADRNWTRINRMTRNFRRAGSGHEYSIAADAASPPLRQVDAVLLDAPCLATGSLARHPEARWRIRPSALASLVRSQALLLDRLAPVVRPGGLLVYATCSLEPEENEEQAEHFLATHPDFHREPGQAVPAALLSPAGDLVILPQRHGMDGAYATRLRRAA